MFLSGILYFAFHVAALAGVPVMMPASWQKFVFLNAGAIWFVLKLPSPARAKPSFRPGAAVCARAARVPMNGKLAAARAEVLRKSRRVWNGVVMVPSLFTSRLVATSKIAR